MHRSIARTFLFCFLILAAAPAIAQRGHTLKIITADSAGIYLYTGGALQNKRPQQEVAIDGLRRSSVDIEVAPAANETAAIRMRIVLGDSTAPKATRFYATTYELIQGDDGTYELHIVSRDPLFRPKFSQSGNMKVLEGHSEDPPPAVVPRPANKLH